LCTHSLVEGHLGCLWGLVIPNKAAINIYVEILWESKFSFVCGKCLDKECF
jgi:hypothetical protein